MTDPAAEDIRLVERLCSGDTNAAHELYRRHGAALLRFGLAMGAARPVAEDMVHDTFVEFLHDPRRFDASRGSVAAYLYGIARHQLSRTARRRGQGSDASDEARAEVAETNAADALGDDGETGDSLDRARLIQRVRTAVGSLPVTQREVIALCDLEELPYATVATILDCPVGTVRSRLHRARAMLAQQLESKATQAAVKLQATEAVQAPDSRAEREARLPATLACRETPT